MNGKYNNKKRRSSKTFVISSLFPIKEKIFGEFQKKQDILQFSLNMNLLDLKDQTDCLNYCISQKVVIMNKISVVQILFTLLKLSLVRISTCPDENLFLVCKNWQNKILFHMTTQTRLGLRPHSTTPTTSPTRFTIQSDQNHVQHLQKQPSHSQNAYYSCKLAF